MSERCGDEDEMERMRKLTDAQLEALLAGKTPAGTEAFEGLAAFTKSVPDALAHTPSENLASAHLARMIEALPPASGLATAGSRSPHGHARRRRTMLKTIFGTLAAKIALVTVAAAAATGGLAAANSLPAPAQDAVSTAVSHLGVHVPNSHATDKQNNGNSTTDANSHGKAVSEVAHSATPGPGHGAAVSSVAKTNGAAKSGSAGSNSQNPTGNGKPNPVPPPGHGDENPGGGNTTGNGKPNPLPSGGRP